jgi:hypothetical protein
VFFEAIESSIVLAASLVLEPTTPLKPSVVKLQDYCSPKLL